MFFKLEIGFRFLDIYFLPFTGNSSDVQDCYSASQRLEHVDDRSDLCREEDSEHADQDDGVGGKEGAGGE